MHTLIDRRITALVAAAVGSLDTYAKLEERRRHDGSHDIVAWITSTGTSCRVLHAARCFWYGIVSLLWGSLGKSRVSCRSSRPVIFDRSKYFVLGMNVRFAATAAVRTHQKLQQRHDGSACHIAVWVHEHREELLDFTCGRMFSVRHRVFVLRTPLRIDSFTLARRFIFDRSKSCIC